VDKSAAPLSKTVPTTMAGDHLTWKARSMLFDRCLARHVVEAHPIIISSIGLQCGVAATDFAVKLI
jgi:hypothetical protein